MTGGPITHIDDRGFDSGLNASRHSPMSHRPARPGVFVGPM